MIITLFLILKTGTQNWTPYLREQTYMGKPWVWFCNLDYFTKQEGDVFNIFENKMCKHEVYIPRKGIKKSDILSFGVLQ